MYVAGIDPGREKCGIAVLNAEGHIKNKSVVARSHLLEIVSEWVQKYKPLTVVIGDGTGFEQVAEEIKSSDWVDQVADVVAVDEHLTTLEARRRYFSEHRPRGLKKLVPTTMQLPPVPYDDYVAVILAERYLRTHR